MKITYEPEVDILTILLSSIPVVESDEAEPGMILDYDKDGNVVGMEILDASKRMENPYAVEYSVIVTHHKKTPEGSSDGQALSLNQRRDFMKLSIAERRHILAQQSDAMVEHYQQNQEL